MAKRKTYDWEAIEKEYRAGQLSIREIGRQYGCSDAAIRQKAKLYDWQRSLAKEVREKVRNELLRADVRKNDVSDQEIVEHAARRGAEVIRIHRSDIRAGQAIVAQLAAQLQEAIANRAEIEETIVDETSEDSTSHRRNQMLKAVSIPGHAGVVRDLSVALKNLIPLERQAYELDEDPKRGSNGTTLEDVIAAIDGTSKGLPSDD